MKIERAIEILDPEKVSDGKPYVALSAEEYFEARKVAKVALEKQMPKEPIKKDTTDHFCYVCPECGHGVWGDFAKAIGCTSTYCQDCGQRLK